MKILSKLLLCTMVMNTAMAANVTPGENTYVDSNIKAIKEYDAQKKLMEDKIELIDIENRIDFLDEENTELNVDLLVIEELRKTSLVRVENRDDIDLKMNYLYGEIAVGGAASGLAYYLKKFALGKFLVAGTAVATIWDAGFMSFTDYEYDPALYSIFHSAWDESYSKYKKMGADDLEMAYDDIRERLNENILKYQSLIKRQQELQAILEE